VALIGTKRARTRHTPGPARRLLLVALALAAVLVGVLSAPTARATPPMVDVYDSIPAVLPHNMASLGFQATQTAEFGDYVHLAGTNRALRTVTVTMSDWALQANPANVTFCATNPSKCPSGGFTHPITLNIYGAVSGSPNTPTLPAIATVTQTFTIPWRPAEDASCPVSSGAHGWRATDDNTCYNGLAFNITFDLSSLNVTLPNDVVIGVAYNTQSWGAHPIGTAGPYNSLNVGVVGTASFGTDDNLDRVFWNTSTANNYTDHGAGGTGTFREDTGWGVPANSSAQGTVPFEITAAPSVPNDVYVSAAFTGSGDPDGAGPASSVGYDAFSTIQAGINAVAAGGTVHVEAGTYAESLTVAKSITLDGGGHAATITGAMSINAANVTVNGFTLTNPAGTEAVRVNGVSSAQITNNDVHDVGGIGSTVNATGPVQAIYVLRSSAADISGIVISGNSISHVRSSGAGSGKSIKAIYVGDSTGTHAVGVTVTGNTINDVVSSGWGAYGILVNHASSGPGSTTADIENNTISNLSGTFAHAIGLEGDTPNAKVIGNTITNVVDSTPATLDAVALKFEDNPHAAQATVTGNSFGGGVPLGIAVNPASAPGTVNAAGNWWGSATAADVHSRSSGNVAGGPWCVDAACASMSNNADLTNLSLSAGTLSPAFGSSTTSYTASVGAGVDAVTATGIAHPGAAVVVSGGTGLHTGINTATLTVTSADGTTKTYTVVINRAVPPLSGNNDLTGLSLSQGTLSPGFGAATTSYGASIDNGVTAISVSAVAASSSATVSVSGGANLGVGPNTITVTVTAANGSAKTYTVTVVRAAAPVAGVATVVQAAPEQAGVASVVVGPVTSGAAAGTTPAQPVAVNVTWPAKTFAVPVEVKVAPQEAAAPPAGGAFTPPPQPTPVAGGFSVGNTVVQLTVTDAATGAPITGFQQPITIHLSASQAGDTPAYSHDGVSWTPIPRLSSPVLPAGQQDGYFLNPDGSVDIYTLHATLFGLLTDTQAPSKPTVVAKVLGGKLYLTLRGAKDNVRLARYRVTLNGRAVKTTARAYLVLPAHAGTYRALALDAAGNTSKPSTTISVVRAHGRLTIKR
jgi:hypothetical protein